MAEMGVDWCGCLHRLSPSGCEVSLQAPLSSSTRGGGRELSHLDIFQSLPHPLRPPCYMYVHVQNRFLSRQSYRRNTLHQLARNIRHAVIKLFHCLVHLQLLQERDTIAPTSIGDLCEHHRSLISSIAARNWREGIHLITVSDGCGY